MSFFVDTSREKRKTPPAVMKHVNSDITVQTPGHPSGGKVADVAGLNSRHHGTTE